ncbi:MAG: hypothetical protein RMI74_04490, partial [Thermodesulfobacterium sp.]|nr:hypothetical protein [Thermodesulfobacterium sp.]
LKWGDLFNSRQKLALISFCDIIRNVYKNRDKFEYDKEFAKSLVSYLSLGINRMSDYMSNLCVYDNTQERTVHVFGRQALPMVWDYSELNPLCEAVGSWESMYNRRIKLSLEHLNFSSLILKSLQTVVTQASATSLPYPDSYFDAVFTDPPYYDNVNYAELSDFFYVWLKRSVGDLYPELFATPLVPKSQEIVANPIRHGNYENAKRFFEENLKKSFQEIHRVLKPEGIAVIIYAHKSTAGWETLINSLLDCGLVVTASWPIDTEMKVRLNAKETASLASSVYLVARKVKRLPIGYLNEVKDEIRKHLQNRLKRLWQEGVSGSDFFVAGIGSAIEVFGKYEQIMDYEGNIIRADKLLEFIREVVTDYAVREILHNGVAGEISPLTRFYILYRFVFKEAKTEFDEARKLASSCGFEIAKYFNRNFIKKEKEFIRVLGPQDRELESIDTEGNAELIDVLHKCLNFWSLGKNDEIVKVLNSSGYGQKEVFYKVAQAISECLPLESKEKRWLDGFLSGKSRYINGIKKETELKQGRLI